MVEKSTAIDSKTHYYWMDLARTLACFAVILIHAKGNEKLGNRLITQICHSAVPIFVMISGTNFLNKNREISIRKMWKKYILPLAIVFLVWSFLYAVWNSYINVGAVNFGFAKNVVINTANGHYHLWYIWMTMGLYAVTPFIKKFTDNSCKKELLYYVLLAAGYILLNFLVCFSPFNNFESLSLDIRLTFVSGFLIYFVGGYFLSLLPKNEKITLLMIAIGLLSIISDIIFAVYDVKYDVNSYFTPFSIGLSFSIYWILSRYAEKFCEKYRKIFMFISGKTLPIYMMHVFGIEIVKKLLSLENYGVGITVLVSVLTFILCFIVSYLLSLNKVTKKLFVGK